jgi:hypothetical protein
MKKKPEFYEGDVAFWEVSNTSGNPVLVPVKVINKVNQFGEWRYLIEPIGGSGQIQVENLVEKK